MARLRAFVVEDSPVILESLVQTLEEIADVEVVATATDEQAALAWMNARTNGCDVIIVDIFRTSGPGLGVLKGMLEFAPPPQRIVLTNYATSELRSRCMALGAEAVFDKSGEIDELMSCLAAHSEQSRL